MIRGLRTVIYPVTDLSRARDWYDQVIEHPPYFDEPFYVGYAVGGFELGLIPDGKPGEQGAMAYWGVSDIEAELDRILAIGADIHEAPRDVGGGIKVAAVKDPFGNPFGLIENPAFKLEDVR